MAAFFIIGERKIRPGLYIRYENWGLPPLAGVDDGTCTSVFVSDWGPVGIPSVMENFADIARIYGDGGDDGTTACPMEQFRGGARRVVGLRLGAAGGITSPGTPATYQIMDAGVTPAPVIQLTMKENNNNPYQLYIGASTGDPDIGELDLLLGSDKLETIQFDISTGADQIGGLIAAAATSDLFTLTLITDTGNALAMPTVVPLIPGTNPVANGTQGTYQIQDDTDAPVIQLTLLHPGSRAFSIAIRPSLADPNRTELLILNDMTVVERFGFDTPAGANQVDSLMSAWRTQGSNFFTLTLIEESDNPIKIVTHDDITPGTDPVINIAAYSAAFEVLEGFRWNVLAIDTNNTAVHMLKQMYLNRVFRGGKFVMGTIGEPSIGADAVPFETRMLHASAYNDYQIVYVGNGFVDLAGTVYDGWLAAARISGLIAGTPSNQTITRGGGVITGAVRLTEPLSNYDYERATQAGMLTFSTSAANTVWVENGINTLVLLGANEDAGWRKIKRVKVRFELFQRLNDTIEPLIGTINNDPDGRMTIIQLGNGVCGAMVAEKKLLPGARLENDPSNPPQGDSAWFLVYADDIDAFEKGYFAFMFRFAPDDAA